MHVERKWHLMERKCHKSFTIHSMETFSRLIQVVEVNCRLKELIKGIIRLKLQIVTDCPIHRNGS